MNRHEAALDLYRANLLLQRRALITARERRIEMLEALLIYTRDTRRAEALRLEIGQLRVEIAAEGPDPA